MFYEFIDYWWLHDELDKITNPEEYTRKYMIGFLQQIDSAPDLGKHKNESIVL